MPPLTPDETLLGLIAIAPRHGYELVDCFRQPHVLGRVWTLSTSQVYAVLKRLEHRGWITSATVRSEVGPPRTEYAITEAGHICLRVWLNEPQPSPSVRRVRVEFLSRLYVAQALGLDPTSMISTQRMVCQRRLGELDAELAETEGVERLAVQLQRGQMQALIAWLDDLDQNALSWLPNEQAYGIHGGKDEEEHVA